MTRKLKDALKEYAALRKAVMSGVWPQTVEGVSTDTRNTKPGDAFIALTGENFEAHDYIAEAAAKGAVMAVVAKKQSKKVAALLENAGCELPLLIVPDTLYALGEIARLYRNRFTIKIIALTGSAGKTTTREMLVSIMKQLGETLSPTANFNNLVGVPLTLFNLNETHKYAVIEMGMNTKGEIDRLTEICSPDVGLITNVMPVHLEGLGTIENIAAAKEEILERMNKNSTAVVNCDDELIQKMPSLKRFANKILFGSDAECAVRLEKSEPLDTGVQRLTIKTAQWEVEAQINFAGGHNAKNALAAAAAAFAAGADSANISAGLEDAKPFAHRLEIKSGNGFTVLDDTYNSNPLAVREAVSVLTGYAPPERRIAVIGEMKELGKDSALLHEETGAFLNAAGLKALYCFGGDDAEMIAQGAAKAEGDAVIETGDDAGRATEFVRKHLSDGDFVLIKGSRAMKLERVVEELLT